jgi:hypothetical protein
MAILLDAVNYWSGQITGMDLPGILKRIENRTAELGITANAVSTAAGKPWAVPNIKKAINQGRKSVALSTVTALAGPLKVSPNWLLSGQPDDSHIESSDILRDRDDSRKTVRVAGYVGASGEAVYYRYSDDQFDYVEPPPGATDQTVAVEVRGGSLGDAFKSWLVFYRDIRSPVTEDLYNRLCVVGLADDRILVKIIKHERDGSFTLLSNAGVEPPIKNAGIEWASRVTDMRPR